MKHGWGNTFDSNFCSAIDWFLFDGNIGRYRVKRKKRLSDTGDSWISITSNNYYHSLKLPIGNPSSPIGKYLLKVNNKKTTTVFITVALVPLLLTSNEQEDIFMLRFKTR